MTIYEVLKANVEALSTLRIPVKEPEIYRVVNGVIVDLEACCKTIEDAEQKSKPASDDIPTINLDEIPEEAVEN